MEPFENQELTDHELDGMLREWNTPPAPAHLRGALFPEQRHWWKRSIRLPIPVAGCAALLLMLMLWRTATTAPARTIVKTEWVEVPVVTERTVTKVVYREKPPAERSLTFHNLRPVAELRPRIIRSTHAEK
jgi:hypothetical protein